ncbi:hypothetical protein [Pseudooceanicola atlanticus]|nr:hypothetical protein [Pseudooceanicola atlanticus]
MTQLDRRRFEALAGYTRHPAITLLTRELDWFSDPGERVLGTLVWDRIDDDYGWAVFGRDAVDRFRAIQANTSYSTARGAYDALMQAMAQNATKPDEAFHQGDETGAAVDFFVPVIDDDRFHPAFRMLLEDRRYSPAREIISAMMRYHEDVDGNFVQKFQAAGWDALLWELYLFATFNELGFVRVGQGPTPDFVLRGNQGSLAIEATSVNPSSAGPNAVPEDPQAFKAYLENYVPIRLSTALRSKLNHRPPYWEQAGAEGIPFCIAVQDFHLQGSMRYLTSAATEYVFGVRHWIEGGERKIAKIGMHRHGKKRAQSGFFELAGAENVSAVLINPQGTITKFNRLGIAAGFGDPRVKMVRMGMKRNDNNSQAPFPTPFEEEVGPKSTETWVEGMVVLHNPNARIPLNPDLIPGAAHEFLQEDGSIMSLLPDFHPFLSQSIVTLEDEDKPEMANLHE